jgi:hypothetical protein
MRDVVWEVVEAGGGWLINSPDRPCHRPVTRQNGDGNVTGDFVLTRPRPRDSRTRDPARVCIPVSITNKERTRSAGDFDSSILRL